jgi:hypothetical protein
MRSIAGRRRSLCAWPERCGFNGVIGNVPMRFRACFPHLFLDSRRSKSMYGSALTAAKRNVCLADRRSTMFVAPCIPGMIANKEIRHGNQ